MASASNILENQLHGDVTVAIQAADSSTLMYLHRGVFTKNLNSQIAFVLIHERTAQRLYVSKMKENQH